MSPVTRTEEGPSRLETTAMAAPAAPLKTLDPSPLSLPGGPGIEPCRSQEAVGGRF